MTPTRGTEVETVQPSGRVRGVAGWVAVVITCLLALQFIVTPVLVWGSAGISGLFGIREAADPFGGAVWLAIAVVPIAVATLTWFFTRSMHLRRERFSLAMLAGSVAGFLTFIPFLLTPF